MPRGITRKICYDENDCKNKFSSPVKLIADMLLTIEDLLKKRIKVQPKNCSILIDYNEENDQSQK